MGHAASNCTHDRRGSCVDRHRGHAQVSTHTDYFTRTSHLLRSVIFGTNRDAHADTARPRDGCTLRDVSGCLSLHSAGRWPLLACAAHASREPRELDTFDMGHAMPSDRIAWSSMEHGSKAKANCAQTKRTRLVASVLTSSCGAPPCGVCSRGLELGERI